ncbi:Rho termination factor N-terminal domain-containing protein [Streptomyces sp. ISL-22]|uniref:Rho termination factor N-terminal domain-containing protein n=1 Tax=unclassified Streptomyces TaxID=2593676 RepID=UPI001BECC09D|nr:MULTISPECIES: Rho termination factor N-terminal domain-containing protein [unclassified Streptomyces]MBT2421860.1 Rho termination factor N-terminal domain-containing protein [Streptomyces sp. ISL-24]MBT2438323.1 Rho termination factor N-terminal domain-containing protein [Streptomyces sp. ISL-22]
MSLVEKLLDAYPAETGMPPRLLGEAVDKLYECAGVCLTCADAAAAEQDPEKIVLSIKCVRLDNDCADLCTVAARILARQTGYDAPTTMAIIEATRTVLRASADAAEEFKDTTYFELSARACRETERLLEQLVQQMNSSESAEGYPTSPPSATTPAGASMSTGTEAPGKSEVSEEQLREMNVDELRDMAREQGLSGVHDMRKEDLIDAISGKRSS